MDVLREVNQIPVDGLVVLPEPTCPGLWFGTLFFIFHNILGCGDSYKPDLFKIPICQAA